MKSLQAFFKYLGGLTLICVLSACGSATTPDFSQMSAKYANILEQYQINMIFQNIVRSSENRPVSFLDMPSITGSGSISNSPSVSGLFTGGIIPANATYLPINGGLANIAPSTTFTVNNTFNFSQSSLDNAVFWKGYLNILPIQTVKYFEHTTFQKKSSLASLLVS